MPHGRDGATPGGEGDASLSLSPRYELRCVVWNTRDVDPGDTNLLGQQMSDIYIAG